MKMNYHRINALKVCYAVFFALLILLSGKEIYAEQFFKTQNTWHEKVPSNPILNKDSANIVKDILLNSSTMYVNQGQDWSVPVCYASANTPITTVEVKSTLHGDYIRSQGWDKVPIPQGCMPAGNSATCAGQYRDGHMVVISSDKKWSWEFFGASYCNGKWSTKTMRKWDLQGNGINYPFDNRSSQRAASVPLLHGLLTYQEVSTDTIDHALAFSYNAETDKDHMTIFPSGNYRKGISARTYAMKLGERLQLDPSVDCNSLNLTVFGKRICKALQTYGMIFVENTGPGYNYVFAEISSSWGTQIGDISAIPLNKLRVAEPVCSDCTVCPNCVTPTPAPPPPPPAPPAPVPPPGSPQLLP